MKITYVGNFSLDFTTETHIYKTLISMGHTVIRIQETPQINPGWINGVPADTDLFLYTRTWGNMVTLEDLALLKERGIPTASYHLDLYVGLSRKQQHNGKPLDEVLHTDPFWRTEYVFSADGDPESQKYFEAHGVNHYWLLPAVYDKECYIAPKNNDPRLQGDVIFVGGGAEYGHTEWPYRHQLVRHLEETYGPRYRKFGHPQLSVRGEDLNQLYANAKIAVGDSVNIGFRHKNYTSDRLFESMGRGAFTIYPRIEGIADIFEEGVNAVFYEFGDFEELDRKINYYLEHEEEREKIRMAGHEFVKSSQTYLQRLQELLDVLTGLGAFGEEKRLTAPLTEKIDGSDSAIRINLGAGEDPTPGWLNVDMIDLPGIDIVHNLIRFPYPFEDSVAQEIKAVDVIEHLPPYIGDEHGVIKFLEECHRILAPGGTLFIQTPGWKAEFLWIDPTHVRGFDVQSMDFFDPDKHYGQTTGFYSKCKFKVRSEELENHNIRFWMEKI